MQLRDFHILQTVPSSALLSLELAFQFLSQLPELFPPGTHSAVQSVPYSFLQSKTKAGIRQVQGPTDPLSNFWTPQAPLCIDGLLWPTREHFLACIKVFLGGKMGVTLAAVREQMLGSIGFISHPNRAKQWAKSRQSLLPNLSIWHRDRSHYNQYALFIAALSDLDVLASLLDPNVSKFTHILPPGHYDMYWSSNLPPVGVLGTPQDQHGLDLGEVRLAVQTLATNLQYFLSHRYFIPDTLHLSLIPNSLISLPSQFSFLQRYTYSPGKFSVPQHEQDYNYQALELTTGLIQKLQQASSLSPQVQVQEQVQDDPSSLLPPHMTKTFAQVASQLPPTNKTQAHLYPQFTPKQSAMPSNYSSVAWERLHWWVAQQSPDAEAGNLSWFPWHQSHVLVTPLITPSSVDSDNLTSYSQRLDQVHEPELLVKPSLSSSSLSTKPPPKKRKKSSSRNQSLPQSFQPGTRSGRVRPKRKRNKTTKSFPHPTPTTTTSPPHHFSKKVVQTKQFVPLAERSIPFATPPVHYTLAGDFLHPTSVTSFQTLQPASQLCPSCGQEPASGLQKHCLKVHLPWFLRPDLVCWGCYRSWTYPQQLQKHQLVCCNVLQHPPQFYLKAWATNMKCFLLTISEMLGYFSLTALFNMVLSLELFPSSPCVLDPVWKDLLTTFHRELFANEPEGVFITPPSHVSSLIHWRILTTLIRSLGVEAQYKLRNWEFLFNPQPLTSPQLRSIHSELLSARVTTLLDPTDFAIQTLQDMMILLMQENVDISSIVPLHLLPLKKSISVSPTLDTPPQNICDSHCHLDLVHQQMGMFPTLDEISTQSGIAFLINCFAFPQLWYLISHLFSLAPCMRFFQMGWHPSATAYWKDPKWRFQFMSLARHSRCKAIGEIGLDFHKSCSAITKQLQINILTFCLNVARQYSKPIVLHLRHGRDLSVSPYLEVLHLMHQNYSGAPVYLHSFLGTWEEAQKWLKFSGRVMFGFCPAALRPGSVGVRDVFRKLSLTNILVESDMPVQSAPDFPTPTNCSVLFHLYNQLALIKQLPIENVKQQIFINNVQFFKLDVPFNPWDCSQRG